VLDWEMSTLGDPLADLGGLLAYWAERDDDDMLVGARLFPPVTAADGFPTREQIIDTYTRITRFDTRPVSWYWAFAYFKLAVICQGIATRAAGGAMLGSGFDDAQGLVEPLIRAGQRALKEGK
jgi:aminoglycoside phosphotransferase (APT) family kinase protein